MQTDHNIYLGTDGTTEFLMTEYIDGPTHLATRPESTGGTWSAPVVLTRVPVEEVR